MSRLLGVLLGGLAGLSAAGLLGRKVLLGLLGATDGAHTGNGLLAEVSAVTVLGSLVGNALVDPAHHILWSIPHVSNTTMSGRARSRDCLLAGAGLGAVGHSDRVLAGLLGVAGLLGSHRNAAVLGSLHADGLRGQMKG